LGLAIVKKIMEDHHGKLVLEDGDPQGARVSLHFAAAEVRAAERSDLADERMELSPVSHGT